MTLGDVASAIGVSPMDVSGWALGESVPDSERLVALAEVFQTPPAELAEMAGISLDVPAPSELPAVEIPEPEPPEPAAESEATTTDHAEEVPPPEPEPAVNLIPAAADVDTPDVLEDDDEREAAADDYEAGGSDLKAPPEDDAPMMDQVSTSDEVLATDPDMEPGVVLKVAEASPEPEPVPSVAAPSPPAEVRPIASESAPARADDPPPFVTPEGRAEQMSGTAPLGYVQDSQMMLRYRIRWAITTVVLVILFFIGLWASRELIDALSLVFDAVTP